VYMERFGVWVGWITVGRVHVRAGCGFGWIRSEESGILGVCVV